MILADSSVWIRHLRDSEPALIDLLTSGAALMHPLIVGEIACGSLRDGSAVLGLMRTIPVMPVADGDDALHFIEHHRLMGSGVGYIDVHLLASTVLARARMWTADVRLARMARELSVDYTP